MPLSPSTPISHSTHWPKGETSLTPLSLPIFILHHSFKFHRLFPLTQYDLPTHNPNLLSFPRLSRKTPVITARPSISTLRDPPSSKKTSNDSYSEGSWAPRNMTPEQVALNPDVDYTRYVEILQKPIRFLYRLKPDVQARLDIIGYFRCGNFNSRRCQSVFSRHVRRIVCVSICYLTIW